jgi:hypothetical protein
MRQGEKYASMRAKRRVSGSGTVKRPLGPSFVSAGRDLPLHQLFKGATLATNLLESGECGLNFPAAAAAIQNRKPWSVATESDPHDRHVEL